MFYDECAAMVIVRKKNTICFKQKSAAFEAVCVCV